MAGRSKKKAKKQPPIHYGKKNVQANKQHKKRHNPNKSMQEKSPEMKIGVVNGKATLSLSAIDTLFFRESRPMEAQGELKSVFPPPMRTLAGAIRRLIGEIKEVNWQAFEYVVGARVKENNFTEQEIEVAKAVKEIIGYDNLGQLRFKGAWLAWKDQRLYPAPLILMQKDQQYSRLQLSDKPLQCDLGKKVRLPQLEKGQEGSKPLSNAWLTAAGFKKVLNNKCPIFDKEIEKSEVIYAKDLFERESRLGIARDNQSKSVKEGLLYQTEHIRPKAALSVQLDVEGLPSDLPSSSTSIIRLGGEGRSASLTTLKPDQYEIPLPSSPPKNKLAEGLLLFLLTPLKFKQNPNDWQPLPEFEKAESFINNKGCKIQQTVWKGKIKDVELILHSAITGKVKREGGWDMAKHAPRNVESLIPEGSVFFCTLDGKENSAENIHIAIKELHNIQIGEMQAYGFGHLAAGLWL
jgi:CRISPR-associated protein Cmr3